MDPQHIVIKIGLTCHLCNHQSKRVHPCTHLCNLLNRYYHVSFKPCPTCHILYIKSPKPHTCTFFQQHHIVLEIPPLCPLCHSNNNHNHHHNTPKFHPCEECYTILNEFSHYRFKPCPTCHIIHSTSECESCTNQNQCLNQDYIVPSHIGLYNTYTPQRLNDQQRHIPTTLVLINTILLQQRQLATSQALCAQLIESLTATLDLIHTPQHEYSTSIAPLLQSQTANIRNLRTLHTLLNTKQHDPHTLLAEIFRDTPMTHDTFLAGYQQLLRSHRKIRQRFRFP